MLIALACPSVASTLEEGLGKVERLMAEASAQGAEIVCFPEAYLPGLRGQARRGPSQAPVLALPHDLRDLLRRGSGLRFSKNMELFDSLADTSLVREKGTSARTGVKGHGERSNSVGRGAVAHPLERGRDRRRR